jgi:hypothetical protein
MATGKFPEIAKYIPNTALNNPNREQIFGNSLAKVSMPACGLLFILSAL